MIKNLLFDLGGVFLDLNKQGAIDRFKKMGIVHVEKYINEYQQAGVFNDVEEGKIDADTFCAEMTKICGRMISFEEAQQAWLGFIDGMQVEKLDYLLTLKEHYQTILISNTNPFVMKWARSKNFSVRNLPLDSYFHHLFMSYVCGYTKPDERFFSLIERETALLPQETLFVDDGAKNILIAQKRGYQTLLVENREDWRFRLEQKLVNSKRE